MFGRLLTFHFTAFLLTALPGYAAGQARPPIDSVMAAVASARAGYHAQALAYLYPYLENHHRDIHAHAETLVVMEWAERYEEAVILALTRPDLPLKQYALKSVIRSARRAGYLSDAAEWVDQGLMQAPDDPDLLALKVNLLADAEQLTEGLALIQEALKQNENADLWLAKARIHQLRQEAYDSLDAVQRAVASKSTPYARRELIYALERCGLPQLALQNAVSEPGLLTADELFRLRRAANGLQIRWGGYPQPTPEQRYAESDLALQQLAELQAELQSSDLQARSTHLRLLSANRLVVLGHRGDIQQVVDEWEAMVANGMAVPDYALQGVADALLYLRRPEESAALYQGLLERQPQNYNVAIGLYYSLHEANRFDEATALAQQLVKEEPAFDPDKGFAVPQTNLDRLSADTLVGLDHMYRNELELAEQHIRPLFSVAPHNLDLRNAFGEIQAGRRRPRTAQRLYEQGLAVAPEHRGLQVSLADSFLLRRQWRLAEQSIARQVALFPDEGATLTLEDEWQRHNLRQLEGRISLDIGDSPDFSGHELSWMLRQWTAPLDYDWRLAAFAENRIADLPEGDASRIYAGVAFERQTPDLYLFGSLALADVSRERLSAIWSGRFELNDHWAIGFGLSRNGAGVSLRTLESDTGGTEYQLSGEWQQHESLSAALELSLLDYDDDNQRTALTAAVRRRLRTGPSFMLDNIVRIAASRNSHPGGFYFAPSSDLDLENELQARWISWRWYADTFTQRASVAAGGYWQEDYGWSLPVSLGYAHEWELQRRRLFIEYGSSFRWRDYDGAGESAIGFYLAFSWRY